MKKFYTLIAAAALCVGSMSAVDFQPAFSLENSVHATSANVQAKSGLVKVSPSKYQKLVKAGEVPELPVLDSQLMFTGLFGGSSYLNVPATFEKTGENEYGHLYNVTIDLFSDAEAQAMPALLTIYTNQAQTEYFVGLEIEGGGKVPFFTADGVTYSCYLLMTSSSSMSYDPDASLQWLYNAETKTFEFGYVENNGYTPGFGWLSTELRGNLITNPEFKAYNGLFTGVDPQKKEYSCPVRIEKTSMLGRESVTISGIYVFDDLKLTLSGDVLTATNALAYTYVDEQGTSTPYYYTTDIQEQTNNIVSAVKGEDPEGHVTYTFGDLYMLNWTLPEDEFVLWYYQDAKITEGVTSNGETAIEGVEADELDANAPVVYYNLQGVRVNNPEGGLFIKRQGNKATKVIL